MKAIVTQMAQEIMDQAAEVGLAAERLQSGTLAVSTTSHLKDAHEALQRAIDTLRFQVAIEPERLCENESKYALTAGKQGT